MKRLLSILLFVFLSECLNAKPIEQETALKVATNFLRLKMPNSGLSQLKGAKLEIDLKLIKTFYKSNELKKASNNKEEVTPCVYIFSDLNKAGFVITSAETSMPPIIGYSYENNIDSNNLPPQLVAIIERWIEITSDPELNINNPENSRIWEDLLYIDSVKTIPDNQNNVEPLIKTKWGQGQFYNDLCPTIEGKKSPVGCVATAVAQLMKYWNYPEYGSGSTNYNVYDQNVAVNFGITKYDWENMPLMVTSPNSAVATLCYHVGAALNMGYGPNQSESTDYSVTLALRNNFNYGPMKYFNNYRDLERLSDYESKIKSELLAGRPVLFSGSNGTIGHTYLCDGMQEDFFHLNYGWDGNSDGFYNLSTEMKFNKNLSLIYEIKPSKMHISERNPMVGESISVNFLVDHSEPIWSISPKENVKIEIDATNSKLINLSFIKMGIYKISLLELNGNDTTYSEENNICVSFPTYKGLEPIRGSWACGQSWPDRWFDYDNDGDLDLFCGYSSYVFENAKGNFVKRYPFSNTYNGSFQVFDYNNDTFLDIVSSETTYIDGKYGLTAFIYKNLKGLGFQKQTIVLPNLGGGGIIPSDFNNDGLIDLFIYGYDYNDNGNPTDEFMGKPKTYILIMRIKS